MHIMYSLQRTSHRCFTANIYTRLSKALNHGTSTEGQHIPQCKQPCLCWHDTACAKPCLYDVTLHSMYTRKNTKASEVKMGSLFVKKEKKVFCTNFLKKSKTKQNKKNTQVPSFPSTRHFLLQKYSWAEKNRKILGHKKYKVHVWNSLLKKKNKTNKHRSNELPLQAKRNNKSEEFSHYSENFKLSWF